MALDASQRRSLLCDPAGWFALGLGSGLSPWAPGTAGSLAAIVPWLALRHLPLFQYVLVLVVAFVLGIWACGRSGRILGQPDHGALVWDEFVGQWLALLPVLSLPWPWVVAAFVLFRTLDIAKPWPIRWADRHCKGGLGVMLDDVLAGGIVAILLALARWFA